MNIELKLKDLKKRAEIFKEENTYTHILTHSKKFFNGFVKKITKEYILFEDDVLGEFPIILNEIKIFEPSKRKKRNLGKNE